MKYLIFVLLFQVGCSFKTPDENKSQINPLKVETSRDSDGDMILDTDEVKQGSNPYIAQYPEFVGDFFQEMKVTVGFYNQNLHADKSVTFHVTRELVAENGVPFEERDFLGEKSEFILEEVATQAKQRSFQGFHISDSLNSESLELFSPPRLNDKKIFPFSKEVYDSKISGFDYDSIEFALVGQIQFNYDLLKSLSDIWLDLLWYDDQKQEFLKIDSYLIKGVYEFNRSYTIPLVFKTTNKFLTQRVSEMGGRFLYLKVREFRLNENQTWFSSIMRSIKSKSIPLLVSNGEVHSLSYVGLDGSFDTLRGILNKGINEDFQVLGNDIVRVGAKANNVTIVKDLYGINVQDERKWFLFTNLISNNPSQYSFSSSDILVLSYESKLSPFKINPKYLSTVLSATPYDWTSIKVNKNNIEDIRLHIRPLSYVGPIDKISTVPCPSNSSVCWNYDYSLETKFGLLAFNAIALIQIKINQETYSLYELVNTGKAQFRTKNSETFEFKFSRSVLQDRDQTESAMISIKSINTGLPTCKGLKTCAGNDLFCRRMLSTPPACSKILENVSDSTIKTLIPFQASLFIALEYL